jgi:signal transduction histidine kinase
MKLAPSKNGPTLGGHYKILRCAAGLGEGRVRQLMANAIRPRFDKGRLIPHLLRWLEHETDEFAKHAIVAVLDAVDLSSYHQKTESSMVDLKLVEAYRYVKDRLRHELRNILLRPQRHIHRLEEKINTIGDGVLRAELETLVGQLSDAFKSVGKLVEFDADDQYFKLRPVSICSWVRTMNDEYGKKYEPISLRFEGNPNGALAQIQASNYLLHSIFWNLWINSHQAVENDCEIRVRVTISPKEVDLLIIDNGDGFPPKLLGVIFQERYSSQGAHRGRGLLEVQEAVQRLRGKAQLVQCSPGDFRVKLSFPLEAT